MPPGQGPGRRVGLWVALALVAVLVLVAIGVGGFLAVSSRDDDAAASTDDDETTSDASAPSSAEVSDSASATAPTEASTTTSLPTPEDVSALAGLWVGSYVCNQGQTRFRVQIDEGTEPGAVEATFTFRPSKANKGVPDGEYLMEGMFADDFLTLGATRWVTQPAGYVTVDMEALVAEPAPTRITGQIVGPGCTTFSMKPHDG